MSGNQTKFFGALVVIAVIGELVFFYGIRHAEMPPVISATAVKPSVVAVKSRKHCEWRSANEASVAVDQCIEDDGRIFGEVRHFDGRSEWSAFVNGAFCAGSGNGWASRDAAKACIDRASQKEER